MCHQIKKAGLFWDGACVQYSERAALYACTPLMQYNNTNKLLD